MTQKEIKVTIDLKLEKIINLDGDRCKVDCCEFKMMTTLDGIDVGPFEPYHKEGLPEGYVACIGNILLDEKN